MVFFGGVRHGHANAVNVQKRPCAYVSSKYAYVGGGENHPVQVHHITMYPIHLLQCDLHMQASPTIFDRFGIIFQSSYASLSPWRRRRRPTPIWWAKDIHAAERKTTEAAPCTYATYRIISREKQQTIVAAEQHMSGGSTRDFWRIKWLCWMAPRWHESPNAEATATSRSQRTRNTI